MSNSKNSAVEFKKNRYLIQPQFLDNPLLYAAYRYTWMKVQTGQASTDDPQVRGTPSLYADTFMETLLEMATPRIESIVSLKLYPTYSYFRVYKQGDELPSHIDRPSCEISVTICLGYDMGDLGSEYRWPIYVDNRTDYRNDSDTAYQPATPADGKAVLLNRGDCMLYRGCEVRHWRHPFEGLIQSQLFIHYVDQNGPYAKYRFDTRPMLGTDMATMTSPFPHPY